MVQLRKLRQEDSGIIFSWISNPELRKMTGTRGTPTLESHTIWFEAKLKDKKNIIRVIVYDEIPVGIIGTNEINVVDKNANIYLYIGNQLYRNKGIALEAINLIIKMLIKDYNCHKITATIRSYNIPSICLFTKCGFTKEGVQKEQIWFDGQYYDRLLFGKIVT